MQCLPSPAFPGQSLILTNNHGSESTSSSSRRSPYLAIHPLVTWRSWISTASSLRCHYSLHSHCPIVDISSSTTSLRPLHLTLPNTGRISIDQPLPLMYTVPQLRASPTTLGRIWTIHLRWIHPSIDQGQFPMWHIYFEQWSVLDRRLVQGVSRISYIDTRTYSSAPTNTFHRLWSRVDQMCSILWLHCVLIVSNHIDPDTNIPMTSADKPWLLANDKIGLWLSFPISLLVLPLLPSLATKPRDNIGRNNLKRSSPTPSGKNMHHATHATKLKSTVLFMVSAIPMCIMQITPITPYSIPLLPFTPLCFP